MHRSKDFVWPFMVANLLKKWVGGWLVVSGRGVLRAAAAAGVVVAAAGGGSVGEEGEGALLWLLVLSAVSMVSLVGCLS